MSKKINRMVDSFTAITTILLVLGVSAWTLILIGRI